MGNAVTQLTFTCSKSTIETLEKGVKYVNNENTRTESMTLFSTGQKPLGIFLKIRAFR